MRLGFVIDHSRCIGCHACSVACKEENQVPLGVYRTWVKYIEKGTFPDVRRHFAVLRCNHCDDAPCVTICPTEALLRADNGIVDFDNEQCIGCKACMQACPYDALYIDPATHTAAKCNFCAHRVEVGLKPSCEVVCPEQAILSGDLDDPGSRISQFINRETVSVRKPEQGTRPKLYYKEVDEHSIDPASSSRGDGYLFAEERSGFGRDWLLSLLGNGGKPADPGLWRDAEERARTTYDVVHHRPWGGKVSAYIFTKSIAAGAPLCAAVALGTGRAALGDVMLDAGLILCLVFLAITSVLLVADLKRPERFWKILFRPQWRSWLAIGAYVLAAFGVIAAATLGARWLDLVPLERFLWLLLAPAAVMAAIYTGFLFSQAEGRDFWQDPALPVHLLIHALAAGSASLLIAGEIAGDGVSSGVFELQWTILAGSLLLSLFVVVCSQHWMRHGTKDAVQSARWLTRGPGRRGYWFGVVLLGHLAPLVLLFAGTGGVATSGAALLALLGLLWYEHLWVLAGQSQPLS